ncbi:MAG: M20/M25/M40 family metallo-hydrolase [Candidatus Aminicenantes bacterium]|nr:M20/M25/M40 family metallo-hydrolase [Candidatus Aminicenantes bacterium]
MRKSFVAFLLVPAWGLLAGGQSVPQAKPEDALKNLVRVERLRPVPEKMKAGFDSITSRDLLALVAHLSHDLMEGRETGTRGYRLAAEYAATMMTLWNIRPAAAPLPPQGRAAFMGFGGDRPSRPSGKTYLQEFPLREITSSTAAMSVEVRRGDAVRVRPFAPQIDFTLRSSKSETVTAPVVFAGYGITENGIGYDDFKGLDVRDKVVLILSEAPGKGDPDSPFWKNKELKDKYFPSTEFARRMRGGFDKTAEVAKRGPAAILLVQNSAPDTDIWLSRIEPLSVPDDRPIIDRERRRLLLPGDTSVNPWEASRVIGVTRETADAVLNASGRTIDELRRRIESTGKPHSINVPGTSLTIESAVETSLVRAWNVVGFIEGSDPERKDEVVIVGAHLDHLGFWEKYIYNGADDNASGSAGVLSIARAMALNPTKPKRSVAFVLWAGEENGLLGSRHYVRCPIFPLNKTAAYFNLDMISRPYDQATLTRMARMFAFPDGQDLLKAVTPSKFLPISFSAGTGLEDFLRQADQYVGLDLFLREQAASGGRMMGGSDHAPFAQAAIPWAFAITAMTSDYHQPSDSADKASGPLMESVSKLIYAAAYLAADRGSAPSSVPEAQR